MKKYLNYKEIDDCLNNEKKYLTYKEIEDCSKAFRVKCKCGHSVMITNKYKRLICSWCGKYVYLNKKDEFKNKLGRLIKK